MPRRCPAGHPTEPRPRPAGRLGRSFGMARGRWVKALRRAKAMPCAADAAVLGRLLPAHDRRLSKPACPAGGARRPRGPGHDLAADALHLVAAVEDGCGLLLTNDHRLSGFPDIPVEVLP